MRKLILCMVFLVSTILFANPVDLSGWQLVQYNASHTYTIPEGTVLNDGEILIISRNSDKASFESSWNVSLNSNVKFLNSENQAPMINGNEYFELKDSNGTIIDGPTETSSLCGNGKVVYRPQTSSNSWSVDNTGDVKPGSLTGITLSGAGVKIVIIGDNGSYQYEFVQIVNDSLTLPDPPSNFSATLTGETQITLSWNLNTDNDPVILIMKDNSPISEIPENGENYEVNYQFSDGSKVIYKGSDTSFVVNNLSHGHTYYFRILSYDQSLTYSNYVDTNIQVPAVPTPDFKIFYMANELQSDSNNVLQSQILPADNLLKFVIKNEGTADLYIYSVEIPSNTHFSLKTKPAKKIKPSGNSIFYIRFTANMIANYYSSINFRTNVGDFSFPLVISTYSKISIPAPDGEITFPDTIVGYKSGIKAITFFNETNSNIEISDIEIDNNSFVRVDNIGNNLTIIPGEIKQIRIVFKPLQVGNISGNLTLKYNGATKTYHLSGTGKDAPQIKIDKNDNHPVIIILNRNEGTFDIYRTLDLTSEWTKIAEIQDTLSYTDTSINFDSTSKAFYKVIEVNDPWADYYAGTEGLTDEALKNKLHEIVSDPFETVGYSNRDYLYTDVDVEGDHIRCIYVDDPQPPSSSPSGINAEHTWPQSYGAHSEPARSDFHHLFPCNSNVNSRRGNIYYGIVVDTEWEQDGTKIGDDANGNRVIEVRPKDRGDIARAIFYFAIRYNKHLNNQSQGVASSDTQIMGFEDVLRQWHHQDPPDDWEKQRNNKIYERYNKNRNPFVDHPEFVDRISDF